MGYKDPGPNSSSLEFVELKLTNRESENQEIMGQGDSAQEVSSEEVKRMKNKLLVSLVCFLIQPVFSEYLQCTIECARSQG